MNSNNRLVTKIVPTGRLEVACSAGDLVGRECFARESAMLKNKKLSPAQNTPVLEGRFEAKCWYHTVFIRLNAALK